MKTLYLPDETAADRLPACSASAATAQPMPPAVATIGFFDGVHRGHQYLIHHVAREAKAAGMTSLAVTFDQPPRQVLQPDHRPALLTTLPQKLQLLSRLPLDSCVVMHFDLDLAQLTAREFMRRVLRDQLNVHKLVIGYDNRFGRGVRDTFDDYVRYGREIGMEVLRSQAFEVNGTRVSSSVVRHHLQAGEIEEANDCLGHAYTLVGKVTGGHHEGRKLGFPTANFDPATLQQLIPATGVYAVSARLSQSTTVHPAMTDIGTRPTFDGTCLSVETHILNFKENIYDRQLCVSFLHRIREERPFDSPEALTRQLIDDRRRVEEQFKTEHDYE